VVERKRRKRESKRGRGERERDVGSWEEKKREGRMA
jgi:hypothetical protein